jgi:5-hydroxyisourate hydrolase
MTVLLSGPDGPIARGTTNADGRCPDLAADGLAPGRYALAFEVAAYFRDQGVALPDPPFLDEVTVEFGIAAEGGHYHVPLLVSPFAYSTYRGS